MPRMVCWDRQPFWGGDVGKPTKLLGPGIANPGGYPITPEQAQWARCRPVGQRTPVPKVGQKGWYRHHVGGELTPAVVLAVAMDDQSDFNVWCFELDDAGAPILIDGVRLMTHVEDPRPSLLLRTQYGHIETREARLAGHPGWVVTLSPKEG